MLELSKHKKTVLLTAIVLCLPMLLILLYSIMLASGGAEFKGITKVRLILPDGTEQLFEQSEDVSFYTKLMGNASALSEEASWLKEKTPVQLYLDHSSYRLYLSLGVSGCVAETPDGRLLLLPKEECAQLLARPEMEYLYADYRLPTLSVVSGEESYSIAPNALEWQYRKTDGGYYPDTTTKTTDELLKCNLYSEMGNRLNFSVEPTSYTLSVYPYENGVRGEKMEAVTSLSGLPFAVDTVIGVEIEATWSQASNAEQYGKASYAFLALYDVPSKVELLGAEQKDSIEIEAGNFVVLRARHTNENELLAVRADFDTENLKFYYNENTDSSYAVIPIGAKVEAGEHHLYVSAGIRESVFTLNVKSPNEAEAQLETYALSEEQYQEYFAGNKVDEIFAALRRVTADADKTPHIGTDFSFTSPVTLQPNRVYAKFTYGMMASFSGTETIDPRPYVMEGTVYFLQKGTEVYAMQSGVVAFVGELGAAGKTVVIDHGYGIFSYYEHLGEITVRVGDTVTQGDTVGNMNGFSGFTTGHTRLQVALSVGNTFVRIP